MQNHILFSDVYLGEQNWKFIDRESCLLNLFIEQRLLLFALSGQSLVWRDTMVSNAVKEYKAILVYIGN